MRKFKWVSAVVAGVILTVASSCSTNRVYSDYVEGINFKQFKTFAWLPSRDTVQNSLYENQIVMQNMRTRVNQEMNNRNYTIETQNPDLLLLVHTNFEEKEELVRTPIYSSYSYFYPGFYAGPGYPYYYNYYNTIPNVSGYDIRSVEFTQGTIVVDVIRADTKELIWRGWSVSRITDPEEFKGEMNRTVEKIFDKYPVEEKK